MVSYSIRKASGSIVSGSIASGIAWYLPVSHGTYRYCMVPTALQFACSLHATHFGLMTHFWANGETLSFL